MQNPTLKVSPEARQVFRKIANRLTTARRKVFVQDVLNETAKKLKSGEWRLDAPTE